MLQIKYMYDIGSIRTEKQVQILILISFQFKNIKFNMYVFNLRKIYARLLLYFFLVTA